MKWTKVFEDLYLNIGGFICSVYGEKNEWHGYVENIATHRVVKIKPRRTEREAKIAALRKAEKLIDKEIRKLEQHRGIILKTTAEEEHKLIKSR